jgi:hypothetical protein
MLLQTVVDSNTFDYVPKDIIDDLKLNLLNFPDALLIFRGEYRTALDTLKSWKKPLVRGVVVTGYSGIGVYCNTVRYAQAALLTETSCSRGFREDILPTLCSPPALKRGTADCCTIQQRCLYSFYRPRSDRPSWH